MTPNGRRVGVAVATERSRNRWFLGLSENGFDTAVLLCKPDSGKVIEICLPTTFFDQFGQYLSRSGGQVKFNVDRRDAQLTLKIPRVPPQPLDTFVGVIANIDR